jgi:hypothetical protein
MPCHSISGFLSLPQDLCWFMHKSFARASHAQRTVQ